MIYIGLLVAKAVLLFSQISFISLRFKFFLYRKLEMFSH
jgi:hypothetical protein